MFKAESSLDSAAATIARVASDPEFMYWSKVLAQGDLDLSEAADLGDDMWDLVQREHGVDSRLREEIFEVAQTAIQLKELASGEA
jgi:hypothetical protein